MNVAGGLQETLQEFQSCVNRNKALRTILKHWDRVVLIQASDTVEHFVLRITNSFIEEIRSGGAEAPDICIRADADVLREVFSGRMNPAQGYMQGILQVRGSPIDQMKLDAIALVMWG